MDLLLFDVTAACEDGVAKSVLREVDWAEKISNRYKGDKAIKMDVKTIRRIIF